LAEFIKHKEGNFVFLKMNPKWFSEHGRGEEEAAEVAVVSSLARNTVRDNKKQIQQQCQKKQYGEYDQHGTAVQFIKISGKLFRGRRFVNIRRIKLVV